MRAFSFSDRALDLAELRTSVRHIAHGGYASFEGWVRNHNEGSAVTALEYEAFESLAIKEGERIIAEACERYGVTVARCVHRVGALALGDVAVWVGVSAPHRDEAFKACRYIIDEVKHRVPIWKKEHYVSGDSGWVNCERCAAAPSHQHDHDHGHAAAHGHQHGHPHHHDHSHSATAAGRTPTGLVPDYSRQTTLPEIGLAGQARLAASHVAVIGAGGLGVPVLQYLAGAGVGQITVIDGDRLEPSNLHRQTWYALADCGQPKAELAAQRVRALNPTVQVRAEVQRLEARNAAALIGTAQILVDCSDNFATQFLVNDLARELGRTAVLASIYQYEGQLQTVRGDGSGPCLRCVWPEATRDGVVGNCAEAGVLGPVPGVLGSLQALRVIEIITGMPQAAEDGVVMLDLRHLTLRTVRARRNPDCGTPCSRCTQALATARATPAGELEVAYESIEAAVRDGYQVIDIRDATERSAAPVDGPVTAIAMQELLEGRNLPAEGRYLFLCARGQRSLAVAQHCRERGLRDARSLRGGVAALATRLAN